MSWTTVHVRALCVPMEAEAGDDVLVEVHGQVERDPMHPGHLRIVASGVAGRITPAPALPPIPAHARWEGGSGVKC